jgi:hypothetical protein
MPKPPGPPAVPVACSLKVSFVKKTMATAWRGWLVAMGETL